MKNIIRKLKKYNNTNKFGSLFRLIGASYQDYNARKVISEVYSSFVLQCTVSGGNVNTRRMSQPDMGSIFHIQKFNEIIWS